MPKISKVLFLSFLFTFHLPILFGLENRPLKIGMELSYPPFEMVNYQGQPAGISVELGRALGDYLQKEVRFENISYVGLVPALKFGKIDLIISSMTITDERKKSIDFSEPYAVTGLCLLTSIHSGLNSIDDANQKGRRIAVKLGTAGEAYAAKNLPLATIRVLDKEAMCVLEVVQGKADAFIYDQLSVYINWQKNPTTTKALLNPFQKEYWGIGVRKSNPELLAKVNEFIVKFRKEGGFDRLTNLYLSKEKAAFDKLGVPFVF